ncbi:Pectinesterase inhibitor domain [Sesbania bispinosa]|nr:Pectinesterase inhibitor domain [Sesbania bispinosa]
MALHTLFGSSMSCHSLFRVLLSLLFISTLLHSASACNSTNTTNSQLKAYKKFIFNQCNSTTYPKVCYKSLTPYASKIKTNRSTLTRTSVLLALKAARSSSKTLTKLSSSKNLTHPETLVIADCRENIDDTVDLLEQSVDGILRLNGTTTDDEKFQWDNIKTWMSAAITDETTCTDEFDEMEVGASLQKKIKTSVDNLAWLTSNALALVNRLTF